MYKRISIFFVGLMLAVCGALFRLYTLSGGEVLRTVAVQQSSYRLVLAKARGNIYDRHKRPLLGTKEENVAVILPDESTPALLEKLMPAEELQDYLKLSSAGQPFVLKIPKDKSVKSRIKNIFSVPLRYSEGQMLAHVIGYLDSAGNGVSGLEKSFDEHLRQATGSLSVRFKRDALKKLFPGEGVHLEDTLYRQNRGVVLTIDERMQKIAEVCAEKYLKKGAILVAQVPDCKIRAFVSAPNFAPDKVGKVLNDPDSPLVNRALQAYNLGSIFKIVTAAALLETGMPPGEEYKCDGHTTVDEHTFHCFRRKAHSAVDLEKAFAHSCNAYFIEKAQKISPGAILGLSKDLGFGKAFEIAPGIISRQGHLPSEEELENIRNMSNFSFGQGTLLVTPLQVLALVNAVAAGGFFVPPQLVKGIVNENLEYESRVEKTAPRRVISDKNAEILRRCMAASVEYGTSSRGKSRHVQACAKTGTAQTGIKVGDHDVEQSWYAGFFPAEKPKFCVVVLAEDAAGGNESCGPVFKKIVDQWIIND